MDREAHAAAACAAGRPALEDGLTESDTTLSGGVRGNDEGVCMPGSVIFNPPGCMPGITVSERAPALLARARHAPVEMLARRKMTFTRTGRGCTARTRGRDAGRVGSTYDTGGDKAC